MSAIRMEENKKVTVLIDPMNENKKEVKGVYLTKNYINPSGKLPEENIFISDNKDWFYYLGYNKLDNKPCYIKDNKETKGILNKVKKYITA